MTVDLIPCVVSILAGIVSIVFGILALRKTRKRESIHQPCYFCGVSEYEHRQECPVAHYRKPFKLEPAKLDAKAKQAWMDGMLKARSSSLMIMPSEVETARVTWPIYGWQVLRTSSSTSGNDTITVTMGDGKPQFKPGQWVRRVGGESSWLLKVTRMDSENARFFYGLDQNNQEMIAQVSYYEPALPRKGEWWELAHCPGHCDPCCREGPMAHKPFVIGMDATKEEYGSAVLCGCMYPVNFGKGNS